MTTINQIQAEIIAEFEFFEEWNDKYEYIVSLGSSIPLLKPEHKIPANLVTGCQSQSWLYAEKKGDKVIFTADAEAILAKGIISLLLRVYSNQTSKDILSNEVDFIAKIGLSENLSPIRANGLAAMLKQIKLYALALQ